MILRKITLGSLILCLSLSVFQTVFGQKLRSKVDLHLSNVYFQYSRMRKLTPQWVDPNLKLKALSPASLDVSRSFPFVDLKKADPSVKVLIEHKGNVAALNVPGLKIRAKIGNFVTADLQLSKLPQIARLEEISYIELSKPCKLELDVSDGMVRASEARNAFGKTGQGVIVGVADTGIDITHPDFQKDGMPPTTRILYLWDQDSDDGSPPEGYNYGSLWTQAQINDEIDGTPAGVVTETDEVGHGTHVAGIAAGNGRATGGGVPAGTYVGMAPEADLIIVKLRNLTELGQPYTVGSADIIEAFE